MRWFRKAAERGHPMANFNVGLMFERGLGVAKNREEAISWYRKAAEQGFAKARQALDVLSKGGAN
jgi:TPR repeat protein